MSEAQVARMSEAEAYAAFKAIRFAENGGEPVCRFDDCGHTRVYTMITSRRRKAAGNDFAEPTYKCAACRRQFTVTSGKRFNSRKMSFRDILYSLMVMVNAVSGAAALRLRRAVGSSYKTSFVFEGKVRVAMAMSRDLRELGGDVPVDIDGKVIGGHRRPHTLKDEKRFYQDARKQQAVVVVRERGQDGESRVHVVSGHELNALEFIDHITAEHTEVFSDAGWSLGHIGPHRTVVHTKGFKIDDIHNNGAESLFARLQRAEEGVYYRIAGKNLDLYAQEVSWREDYRRECNGTQWLRLLEAVTSQPISKRWKGYWQRWQAEGVKRRSRPWKNRQPSVGQPC